MTKKPEVLSKKLGLVFNKGKETIIQALSNPNEIIDSDLQDLLIKFQILVSYSFF